MRRWDSLWTDCTHTWRILIRLGQLTCQGVVFYAYRRQRSFRVHRMTAKGTSVCFKCNHMEHWTSRDSDVTILLYHQQMETLDKLNYSSWLSFILQYDHEITREMLGGGSLSQYSKLIWNTPTQEFRIFKISSITIRIVKQNNLLKCCHHII